MRAGEGLGGHFTKEENEESEAPGTAWGARHGNRGPRRACHVGRSRVHRGWLSPLIASAPDPGLRLSASAS